VIHPKAATIDRLYHDRLPILLVTVWSYGIRKLEEEEEVNLE